MPNEPFLKIEGDTYKPQPVSAGPWDPNSLHGRVVAGLLAHEIERQHGGEDLQPARLQVVAEVDLLLLALQQRQHVVGDLAQVHLVGHTHALGRGADERHRLVLRVEEHRHGRLAHLPAHRHVVDEAVVVDALVLEVERELPKAEIGLPATP